MNLRQAAQQALEALEQYKGVVVTGYDPVSFLHKGVDAGHEAREAITALRAALAEPERKPLTEQEIQTIWAKTFEMGSSANTFARAIERAHGIGDNK